MTRLPAAIRLLLLMVLLTALAHAASGSHARRSPAHDNGTDTAPIVDRIDAEIEHVGDLDLEDTESEAETDASEEEQDATHSPGAAPDSSADPSALLPTAAPLAPNARLDIVANDKANASFVERSAEADEERDVLGTPLDDYNDPNWLALKQLARHEDAQEASGPLEDFNDPNWIESKASAVA